jgi:hypothetical protein
VSCKGGALGKYSVYSPPHVSSPFFRCTAKRTDLDGGVRRRSREHTELLVSEFELGTLWDEYGLVGDIIVHVILTVCLSRY